MLFGMAKIRSTNSNTRRKIRSATSTSFDLQANSMCLPTP